MPFTTAWNKVKGFFHTRIWKPVKRAFGNRKKIMAAIDKYSGTAKKFIDNLPQSQVKEHLQHGYDKFNHGYNQGKKYVQAIEAASGSGS